MTWDEIKVRVAAKIGTEIESVEWDEKAWQMVFKGGGKEARVKMTELPGFDKVLEWSIAKACKDAQAQVVIATRKPDGTWQRKQI